MRTATAALAASFGTAVYAQSVARTCPNRDICYALNIPASTASSGKGVVFFQITAPTSYRWVAIGQGSSMSGSNIFVVYTSGDGNNVTVSPRLGTGYAEPQHDTHAQIEVLAGSGVRNGKMTANVRCRNCDSWSGGRMDFTGSSSDWIHAYKSGDAMGTDDVSAPISRHDNASPFTWNLSSAKGGDSVNPFVSKAGTAPGTASAPARTTAATPTCMPRPTSTNADALAAPRNPNNHPPRQPSDLPYCDDDGPSSNAGSTDPSSNPDSAGSSSRTGDTGSASFSHGGAPFGGDSRRGERMVRAHGALASLAFVGLFPTGGMLMRMGNFTGLVWVHAAVQGVGYLLYTAAVGLGVYVMSQRRHALASRAHPVLGGVLLVVLLAQPLTGWLHHRAFRAAARRTAWSHAHLGLGRAAVLAGIVNGGLGLALAAAPAPARAAYAVVAALMALLYAASIVLGERRRRTRHPPPPYGQPARLNDHHDAPIGLTEHFGKTPRR